MYVYYRIYTCMFSFVHAFLLVDILSCSSRDANKHQAKDFRIHLSVTEYHSSLDSGLKCKISLSSNVNVWPDMCTGTCYVHV